jgi:hypothetical protein
MLHLRIPVVATTLVCVALVSAPPRRARAQTVSASAQVFPARDQPLRPQNLNPLGVSYSDCINDMTLAFSFIVSGFDGAENLQVWASKTSDCTALTDRGTGQVPVCWILPGGFTAQPFTTPTSIKITLRVQDILGEDAVDGQNPIPDAPDYHRAGAEACTTQATPQAVPININFVPVDASGNPVGTAYQYTLNTDLVGPPAPAGVSESAGPTLLKVMWTPNSDTDTTGYDVFIDPIPGQEGLDSGAVVDSGSATPSSVNRSNCTDQLLASGVVRTPPLVDDAGNSIEGGGGISTVPDANRVGNNPTVSDESVGQFTLTGLTDYVTYTVVVAAVDGYGNVGPPSGEVCDRPAPVQGGGNAGGSCALEGVGTGGSSLTAVGCFLAAGAYARRRRPSSTRSA